MTDAQAYEIISTLGKLVEKIDNIDHAVLGNGQPGHEQRIQALEASRNETRGALWLLSFFFSAIGGVIGAGIEYVFHAFRGK
jgi:hypothetical protein